MKREYKIIYDENEMIKVYEPSKNTKKSVVKEKVHDTSKGTYCRQEQEYLDLFEKTVRRIKNKIIFYAVKPYAEDIAQDVILEMLCEGKSLVIAKDEDSELDEFGRTEDRQLWNRIQKIAKRVKYSKNLGIGRKVARIDEDFEYIPNVKIEEEEEEEEINSIIDLFEKEIYKKIIVLKYHGLTTNEIAEKLNLSKNGVIKIFKKIQKKVVLSR